MANVMPEVKPVVTSMPTTGWFLQTSGSSPYNLLERRERVRAELRSLTAAALAQSDTDRWEQITWEGLLRASQWRQDEGLLGIAEEELR